MMKALVVGLRMIGNASVIVVVVLLLWPLPLLLLLLVVVVIVPIVFLLGGRFVGSLGVPKRLGRVLLSLLTHPPDDHQSSGQEDQGEHETGDQDR